MPFACGILEEGLKQKVEEKDWELYRTIIPWMKQPKSFQEWRDEIKNSGKNNNKSADEIRKQVKEVRKRLG